MEFKGHALYDELVALGIVHPEAITEYYPRVRDRADVGVLRCARSGVIFLSRIDHISEAYYGDMADLSYWSRDGRAEGLKATYEDDLRRAMAIRDMIRGRSVVDVGTGLGGVLDLMKQDAKELFAVEPQKAARIMLQDLGYRPFASAEELRASGRKFDVVTLFHVFEHLVEPLEELRRLHDCLAPGGRIVIEVPHARDALLNRYSVEAFKKFTFWGEHLILHTRDSLSKYLAAAGFADIEVHGVQRYPLSNHLYWLSKGEPGGQVIWAEMRDAVLERSYDGMLDSLDMSDTLMASASKKDPLL